MNWFAKFFKFCLKHKIISAVVVVALIGGGYFWYSSAAGAKGKVSYVTVPATKGTIVTSVSGSGQVSPSNEVDLKSQVSENVVYVGVAAGQKVAAGALLMEFDTTDAEKTVRDAELSLQNAQLSLQKTQSASTTLPLTQQQDQDNLTTAYSNAFNTVSNTFLDLPGVMTGLNDVLYGTELDKNFQQNLSYYYDSINPYNTEAAQYRDSASSAYQKALTSFNQNFNDYKSLSRSSSNADIDAMLSETYQTTQNISDAIKDMNNFIQLYQDTYTAQSLQINTLSNTQLSTLSTYTGTTDTDLSNLLSIQTTIKNDEDAITNDGVNLQSQGLSIQGQDLSITQAQNALSDAKDNLANCYIYAPFDGIVASVDYVKGDAASSGSTAVTFITNQDITEIPLNEVDISKIQIGQKAVLTFDALPDLTIAGSVLQIDTLGTVTQGVVNYNVEIAFDASGTQVKPGMSISANIITDVEQDVLTVPNSAVKTSGGMSYVQVLVNGKPVRKTVQTGLVNDTDTEITSGINEGDNVITQTITTSATTSGSAGTARTTSLIPGIGGGGGGFSGGGGGFGGGARGGGG